MDKAVNLAQLVSAPQTEALSIGVSYHVFVGHVLQLQSCRRLKNNPNLILLGGKCRVWDIRE